ncbi:hypothetical protein [Ornithinibacillus halotolerans]|uniref:Uncharacterized protein n=1 Tax=Ornithinibacillus halotolerans TaxID=1274357 RepID=A0A916S1E2_9BACI|nr:hypothetical protein [Ornithinibacillus halotolerans]GGA80132.1 hypothetical protein GCM10008025_24410 [Ornithinibacillus halotolerans]
MRNTINVNLSKYMDEKTGLLTVREWDNSKIHQSWKINEGRIIVFESNLEDFPANALLLFEDIDEYIEAIKDVRWINCEDFIINHSEDFRKMGFPFS